MNGHLKLKPHGTKGTLITFCGLDGCGKSTMIQRLKIELEARGYKVLLTKQPTEVMRQNRVFRTYMDLEDHSAYEYRSLALMAAADRVQHCKHVILKALEQGEIVISDRYFYSCLANLHARGYVGDRWIYEIAKQSIPDPDLAFFLDVPVKTAVARVRKRPEEKDRYVDMELQYKLQDEYRTIAKKNRGVLISSDREEEKTYLEILNHVNKQLGGNKNE